MFKHHMRRRIINAFDSSLDIETIQLSPLSYTNIHQAFATFSIGTNVHP